MIEPGEYLRARIYLDSGLRHQGRPLYRAVVEHARARHLAGASVFLVDLGYGRHHRWHDAHSEYDAASAPVEIDLVEARAAIQGLLAELAAPLQAALILARPARVVRGQPAPSGDLAMPQPGPARRLTVYVSSRDTWHGRNLAIALIERCRALGIAGASAALGVLGYGRGSRIHRAHLLGLSDDLPERVEIVDRAEAIDRLVPELAALASDALMVVEDVEILHPPPAPE